MNKNKLLLFDIDGTLLHTDGAGKRAMNRVFYDLFSIEKALDGVDLAGRTDEVIISDVLHQSNLPVNGTVIAEFKNHYFNLLPDEIAHNSPKKCLYPGVIELLKKIKEKPELTCGLLTGNWEKSAYIKLAAFGIDQYFELGAFADDFSDRNKLVPVAVARMKQLKGYAPDSRMIFVIGDTPKDVACALANNAIAVAVASNLFNMKQLEMEGPHFLLQDLSDTEKVMQIFSGL